MVRRTARARVAGRAETFHSPSSATGETLCSRCRAQSIGVESSCGKVDDPRPVALTWGGAGVDHTPYPIPQGRHTRLGHYSPIATPKVHLSDEVEVMFFGLRFFGQSVPERLRDVTLSTASPPPSDIQMEVESTVRTPSEPPHTPDVSVRNAPPLSFLRSHRLCPASQCHLASPYWQITPCLNEHHDSVSGEAIAEAGDSWSVHWLADDLPAPTLPPADDDDGLTLLLPPRRGSVGGQPYCCCVSGPAGLQG